VNALKDILQRQRDGFHLFYEQTTARAASIAFIEDPTLPRQRKVPRRFQHGDDKVRNIYSGDIDFEQLEAELKLLTGIVKQQLPEVKEVTSIDTIVPFLSDWCDTKLFLSNIFRVLQIYLLALMCIASGERSFSAQRRMKTYLRSTMPEKRYNNLLMLHVHKDRTDEIDLKCIAREFVQRNQGRHNLFGSFLNNNNK
uniref:Uncharacterized protein n=1 Tax=Latimeria chalumnae TaxID=7897 RepID=H3AEC9_LATCH